MLLPSVGDTVNERYRIDAILARGGMGVVYRGTQLTMAREVAIKMVLAENQASDRHLERFRREVQIAMRLRHPSVVEIYDFGQTADGLNFIVMEFLEGQDLKAVINQQGAFKVGRARMVVEHVLDALCAAHESNVIHRDLKPSNIMLTRVGRGRELPKILDFGIAKSVGEHTELTMSGEVLGSIPYLAPEGLRGESSGFTADVYAMGLITLEMFTGMRVRQGPNTAQIVAQHLTRDVVVPKELQGTALENFIKMSCARDPRQRYPNAMAMYDALGDAFKDIDPELLCEGEDILMLDDPYGFMIDEAKTTATPSSSGDFEEGRLTQIFGEALHAPTAALPSSVSASLPSSTSSIGQEPILQPRLDPPTQSSEFEVTLPSSRRAPVAIGAFLLGSVCAVVLLFNQGESGATHEEIGEAIQQEAVQQTEFVESPPAEKFDIEPVQIPDPVGSPVAISEPEVALREAEQKKPEVEKKLEIPAQKKPVETKTNDSASKKGKNGDTRRQPARTRTDDDPFSVRKF